MGHICWSLNFLEGLKNEGHVIVGHGHRIRFAKHHYRFNPTPPLLIIVCVPQLWFILKISSFIFPNFEEMTKIFWYDLFLIHEEEFIFTNFYQMHWMREGEEKVAINWNIFVQNKKMWPILIFNYTIIYIYIYSIFKT